MRCILAGGLLVALVGCGGGGGEADPIDVSGWWYVTATDDPESSFWKVLDLVELEDTGPSVWVVGMQLARSGAHLHVALPDETDPGREEIDLDVASPDLLTGTITRHKGGKTAEVQYLRLERTQPLAGSFSADGTADGAAISRSTPHAWAARDTDPDYVLDVKDNEPRSPFALRVDFDTPAPAAGAYAVGNGPGEVRVEIRLGRDVEIDATGGTVTFTELDAGVSGSAAGSYDVNLADGGRVYGAFDVETQPYSSKATSSTTASATRAR